MKRRNFILLASTASVAIAIPAFYINYNNIDYDKSLAIPKQLTTIWDFEKVISIGLLYRTQVPNESSEQKLAKLLLENISVKNELSKEIQKKIISDYKIDKIAIIDGWILSKTEARQCALFSLLQTKQ